MSLALVRGAAGGWLVALAFTCTTTGADPATADIRRLVAEAAARPSVHADRPTIEAALAKHGVPQERIDRLWPMVEAAVLPGMGSRLDGFLFQTRDPDWLPLRDEFAEFLTLRGVDRLTKRMVKRLAGFGGVISFPDIVELDPDSARLLRGFGADDWGTAVEFPGMRSIDAASASELARCGALVALPSLEGLSTEAATALARHEGTGLVIGGVSALADDVATALADCRSMQGLLLPDLEALESVPLARRLARQDSVFLPRVPRLSPEIAAALRGNDGGSLSLPGLTSVPGELARQLVTAGFFGLTLGGLGSLDAETAAVLAGHPGPLVFTGMLPPSPEIAALLDRHEGDLVFQHLPRLPADVAARLGSDHHLLVLPGVTTVTADEAAALAASGPLSLPSLSRLDETAAAALATHRHPLQLDGLREVSPPTAAALARHLGSLRFAGVTSLSAESAAALAACPGDLDLDGITSLDRPAAAALLARDRPLVVHGLQAVTRFESVEVARLAVRRIDDPAFPFVTAIDGPEAAAIATALAESRGTLMLPALRRITSRSLTALLKKADVELPPVESLRIVPDPGGGADDFVDPR